MENWTEKHTQFVVKVIGRQIEMAQTTNDEKKIKL